MQEIKPIKGFQDCYGITITGKVWSFKKKIWRTITKDEDGYMRVCLHKNRKHKLCFIHRLMYETFVREIKPNEDCHHINHIRDDNRLQNLIALDKSIHRSGDEISRKKISNSNKGRKAWNKGKEFIAKDEFVKAINELDIPTQYKQKVLEII